MPENEQLSLDNLIQALQSLKGNKNKAASAASFSTATMLHQPGGIFAVPGMEREVISTHIRPMGIGSSLPAYASAIDDPRFGVLTGFTATTGSEPTNPCDDAPKGYMKGGTLTAQFGRLMRETQTIEIDKVLHEARGAPVNLQLMGSLLGMMESEISQANVLDLVTQAEMVGVGVQIERKEAVTTWQGNPANNTSGGGYKEYPGLDRQIATGQVDAESNVAMPAADSLIYDFGHTLVDNTTIPNKDIVEYVSMMEYYLFHKAQRQGVAPVTWVIAMRPELWHYLTMVWPCRYYTNRCNTASSTSNIVSINDDFAVRKRDEMRAGMFIEINGRRYNVVVDDGIFEHTNATTAGVGAGTFSSALYFVPIKIRGNFPVTYWQFIDYRNIRRQLSAFGAGARNVPFWTDGGRILWVYVDNGYCFKVQGKVEHRVVLRTPWLAGKIQAVRYAPMQHLNSPFPDSPYFQDGGVSFRSVTSGFHVW